MIMEIEEYKAEFMKNFEAANAVAIAARAKGFDPETAVEIRAAPDLASRVEGIIAIDGIAELIKQRSASAKSRQELAFDITKEICTNPRFSNLEKQKLLTLAVRVGLCILTEGVLVAPTEGMQGVELHKNPDGTDYIAVVYAGPIRGAGGTSAALSVALADLARKTLGIGVYRPSQTEVERYVEEMLLYHARCARLQYLPSEADMRLLAENCPVCVDSIPTEDFEVGIHRNMKRLDATGKEQPITNKIRGGMPLVMCEGIAQKAKSVLKYTKGAGLDWDWLNKIIRVDKATSGGAQTKEEKEDKNAVFLQELVAGRPVLAYPGHKGSFRLRYGRSRMTGIAAKGFNPASMLLLGTYIATGTQLKVEKPGKGCIATPVDSIEGPFVKLKSGEALRVNTAEHAEAVMNNIAKILSVGDILATYGDFKKSNTPLAPTSYVEEYWQEQLKAAGYNGSFDTVPSFHDAYNLSTTYKVPMHPRYIYDYAEVSVDELKRLALAMLTAEVHSTGETLSDVSEVLIRADAHVRDTVEKMCIPHFDDGSTITIKDYDARSLLASLGFVKHEKLDISESVVGGYDASKGSLEMLNAVAPFRIMKRATRIGARIGRPEKAKERLMKPAPHMLFPISEYGGKERSLYKAYVEDKRRFGTPFVEVEIAKYKCSVGKERIVSPYCSEHNARGMVEKVCKVCGRSSYKNTCPGCGNKTFGFDVMKVNLPGEMERSMKNIGMQTMPKAFKGVKGLVSRDKIAEPLEKGLLRAMHGIYIFKDGTSRFDATDTPMTHFYPKEIKTSVERLRELGYTADYQGKPLENDDQLVEMRHQDVVINRRGAEYLLKVAKFVDDLLVRFYKLEPFYKINTTDELIGQSVITLSPHTSCGVLGRIIGFTEAHVGFAHPYTITARRRNCDGDEDTTMLLLDALVNFSRKYLPVTIGGTMDAPLILTINILPEEVDDEVHDMEVVQNYGLAFYDKTMASPSAAPSEVTLELVRNRLGKRTVYQGLSFTHHAGPGAVESAPLRSVYTTLKTMQDKIDKQFELMDRLCTIDKADTARRLLMSHFIPDLIGNLHSFSKQTFRCVACNAKYRRVPLSGKCGKCTGKLVLTISKGGIEKYLNSATNLADRYNLEPYIKQRIMLIRMEIEAVFGGVGGGERPQGQFNLANYV